ncbi:MAG: hypothetical protein Q4F95_03750 [Oscillospiraceae bacterium]|nr:hypothetical protein [Oscillospiraceae bacterium]
MKLTIVICLFAVLVFCFYKIIFNIYYSIKIKQLINNESCKKLALFSYCTSKERNIIINACISCDYMVDNEDGTVTVIDETGHELFVISKYALNNNMKI